MTRYLVIVLFHVLAARVSLCVEHDLWYYLPADVTYDESIPTPRSVLGHDVGEYHARHDQLLSYFRTLAAASARVTVERYGLTHEKRELILVTVTAPENHARIAAIREDHIAALTGETPVIADDRPAIVWLGYSVHGNESSGSNAALLVAYHLAAARGVAIDDLLRNSVILLDPSINPDGLSRFAQWANSHRGKNVVADPEHREHREVWPGGRTNHYWFDLNRDWLLLAHPESRGRLEMFHRWKPNIVGDFHEMETSSTYFFQPGVPERQNPNTPAMNLELTRRIARYHAKALDAAGSLYYSEERFDDFYYGKGSTYPDVNGGIGILFEQASSRGHLQESGSAELSFPFTIRNQFLTSLSTLNAALEMRVDLLAYQGEFYRSALFAAAADPVRAWVFGGSGDPAREYHFLDILTRHQIVVARLAEKVSAGGHEFEAGDAYIVSVDQPQYRLVRSLFERRSTFADDTFYDVSTWTLPLSFGLPHGALDGETFQKSFIGEPVGKPGRRPGRLDREARPYAYLFEWSDYYAPRAVNRLFQADVRIRVSTRPFEVETADGVRDFGYGTIVVPRGTQELSPKELADVMGTVAAQDGIDVHTVSSGLTVRGIDLGSPQILEIRQPRPVMLVGSGISAYEAGEVWHLLDQRFDVELSMVEIDLLARLDLHRYTHVVLVSGSYGSIGEEVVEKLRRWIRSGGVLVAIRGSIDWVEKRVMGRGKTSSEKADDADRPTTLRLPYVEYEKRRARSLINGAILAAEIDRTHPIGFGYTRGTLPVFRNSTIIMEPEVDPFATVLRYSDAPLLSGFTSPENLRRISGTAVVCATRMQGGLIVRIVDNPNFRGVWYGTNRLFLNALFLGHLVKRTGTVE